MSIDPTDWVDQQYLFGTYEVGLREAIEALVRPGEICLDIGAQKGYVTLQLARAVGESGLVIAVEPDPRAMEQLNANCSRNGICQVALCPFVVGDADGECEFVLSEQLGYSSRFPNEIARPLVWSTLKVKVKTVDGLLEELAIPRDRRILSFVKIDVEGSEPLVLSGMKRTLKLYHPMIWLEVNRPSLQAGGFHVGLLERPLRDIGYRFFRLQLLFESLAPLRRAIVAPIASLGEDPAEVFDVLAVFHPSNFEERLEAFRGTRHRA